MSDERRDELQEMAKRHEIFWLPVFAYVHGGATIRTTPFADKWDSGRSGIVYCTVEKAREWCQNPNKPPVTWRTLKQRALKALEAEVKVWDAYLQGQVYGYTVEDKHGEHIASCWGFYGDEQYVISSAKLAYNIAVREEKDRREAARKGKPKQLRLF